MYPSHSTSRPAVAVYADEVLIDIPSKAWDKAPSVVDRVEDAQVVDEKAINPLMALSITPGRSSVKRKAARFCLHKKSLDLFFRDFFEVFNKDRRRCVFGETYEHYLGSWRVTIKHHYEVHEERGGDSHNGVWETYPVVDRDEIEVISAFDENRDRELPGLVCKLNEFCKGKNY